MDKKNIFIAVVLLAVVVLVATNFERFTGQAVGVQETTTIEIENKYLESGEYVYATIFPGKKCADLDLELRNARGVRLAQFSDRSIGRSRYCDAITVHYKTGGSWEEGEYTIRAQDIATGEWAEDTFVITG